MSYFSDVTALARLTTTFTPLAPQLRHLRLELERRNENLKLNINNLDKKQFVEEKDNNSAKKTYALLQNISEVSQKLGEIKPSVSTPTAPLKEAIQIIQELTDALVLAQMNPPTFEGVNSVIAANEYRGYLEQFQALDLGILELQPSSILSVDDIEIINNFKKTVADCDEKIKEFDQKKRAYLETFRQFPGSSVIESEIAIASSDSDDEVDLLPIADARLTEAEIFADTRPINSSDVEYHLDDSRLSQGIIILTESDRLEAQLKNQKAELEQLKLANKSLAIEEETLIEARELLAVQYQADPKLLDFEKRNSQHTFLSKLVADSSDESEQELLALMKTDNGFASLSLEFKEEMKTYEAPSFSNAFQVFGKSPLEHLQVCLAHESERIEIDNQDNAQKQQAEIKYINDKIVPITNRINNNNLQISLLQHKIKSTTNAIIKFPLEATATPEKIQSSNEKYKQYINYSNSIIDELREFLVEEAERCTELNALKKGEKKATIEALIQEIDIAYEFDQPENINKKFLNRVADTLAAHRNTESLSARWGFATQGTKNFNRIRPDLEKKIAEREKLHAKYKEANAPVEAQMTIEAQSKLKASEMVFDKIKETLETGSFEEKDLTTIAKFAKELDFMQDLSTEYSQHTSNKSLYALACETKNQRLMNQTQSFIGEFYQAQLHDLDPKSERSRDLDICLKPKIQAETTQLLKKIKEKEENITTDNYYAHKETYGKILAYTNLLTDINVHAEIPTIEEAKHIKEQLDHYQLLMNDSTLPQEIKTSMASVLNAITTYIQKEEPEWGKAIGLPKSSQIDELTEDFGDFFHH